MTMTDTRNPGGDPTGLLQSLRQHGEGSLLDYVIASKFARAFIGSVLKAVANVNAGRTSRDLGVAAVQADCRYYAGVLSGRLQLDGYSIDPSWHPAGLASHIREVTDIKLDGEDAIEEFLALVAHGVFDVLRKPEGEQEAGIDALVVKTSSVLVGVHV